MHRSGGLHAVFRHRCHRLHWQTPRQEAAGAQGRGGALPDSQGKRRQGGRLREYWGVSAAKAVPVFGDLTAKKLGVSGDDIKKLKGQIDHFYHLAAVYDLGADEESQIAVNIEGTRNTVELAKAIDAGHFHHVSSIAAAGLYEGVFREDMFDEAENYDHPTS
jgi:thioester reductase-like protein